MEIKDDGERKDFTCQVPVSAEKEWAFLLVSNVVLEFEFNKPQPCLY